MGIYEIIIHGSKDESVLLTELGALQHDMNQCMVSCEKSMNSFYVTIVGVAAKLTTQVCERLLEVMRCHVKAFPGNPCHIRLLRIDQHAKWCDFLLSTLKTEPSLTTRIDLELHSHLRPTLVDWMEQALRSNQIRQLKIETMPLQFGMDPSHRNIICALNDNTSLEALAMNNFSPPDDASTTIRSLLEKPKLRRVSLREPVALDGCRALREVLCHSKCPIEDLTIVNQSHSIPSYQEGTSFTLKRPNQSVKRLRLLRWWRTGGAEVAAVLSSFEALEEISVNRSGLKYLPMPTQGSTLPLRSVTKKLRILDLSGSEIIERWATMDTKDLAEAYGSLLQYKLIFPDLKIYGFPNDHRIFWDYPKFIEQQSKIPAMFWPHIFSLLSMLGWSDLHRPIHSPDHCYAILQQYLSHQACGLIPDTASEISTKETGDAGTEIRKSLSNLENEQTLQDFGTCFGTIVLNDKATTKQSRAPLLRLV